MNLHNTNTCCTALELGDFEDEYGSFKVFKENLRKAINSYDEEEQLSGRQWGDEVWLVNEIGLIVAFTTDLQPEVNKYLEMLEFTSSPFFKKEKHEETMVAVHWISAKELCEKV